MNSSTTPNLVSSFPIYSMAHTSQRKSSKFDCTTKQSKRESYKNNLRMTTHETGVIKKLLGLPLNAGFDAVRNALTSIIQLVPKTYSSVFNNKKIEHPQDVSQITHSQIQKPNLFHTNEYNTRHPEIKSNNNFTKDGNIYRPSDTDVLFKKVRNWNLRFDGKRDSDAISFLERLNELIEAYDIEPDKIVKVLPEMLKDVALLWYRNNKHSWKTYVDFVKDFHLQFFPRCYSEKLEDEIRLRTQGENELFTDYVVALLTLIRRIGTFSESDKLERIYKNMHPSYKLHVRKRDFVNLPGLIKVAEEYEAILRDILNYRPPPSPDKSLFSDTAYQPITANHAGLKENRYEEKQRPRRRKRRGKRKAVKVLVLGTNQVKRVNVKRLGTHPFTWTQVKLVRFNGYRLG